MLTNQQYARTLRVLESLVRNFGTLAGNHPLIKCLKSSLEISKAEWDQIVQTGVRQGRFDYADGKFTQCQDEF